MWVPQVNSKCRSIVTQYHHHVISNNLMKNNNSFEIIYKIIKEWNVGYFININLISRRRSKRFQNYIKINTNTQMDPNQNWGWISPEHLKHTRASCRIYCGIMTRVYVFFLLKFTWLHSCTFQPDIRTNSKQK